MADLSWEARLIEMDADAVRQRMAANAFRLGPPHIAALRRSVELALDEESRALEALEAESLRQQQQQQHAIKYGQYLTILSAHLEAASGGSIGMIKLAPESDEVRQALGETGLPLGAPFQVLHAFRLRHTRLHTDFYRRAGVGSPQPASSGTRPSRQHIAEKREQATLAAELAPRLMALRLLPGAVEHALVHGLHPKPAPGSSADWQVDPSTVPEAACVDMASLSRLVATSTPPLPPFALFSGRPAWDELLAGAVEEVLTARDAAAAGLTSARGPKQHAPAQSSAAAAAAAPLLTLPHNKLLLLCRVLPPNQASQAAASHGHGLARGQPPPGTATAHADMLLPSYLLHYTGMTAPPSEPPAGNALAMATIGEKNVQLQPESRASESRAGRNDVRKGVGRSGSAVGGNGSKIAANRAEHADRADNEEALLPASLRATREYQHYLECRKESVRVMRQAASVFAATVEAMRSQLTPARAQALVEEARREAELHMLVTDAKTELARLKKVNRDLASELNTTY